MKNSIPSKKLNLVLALGLHTLHTLPKHVTNRPNHLTLWLGVGSIKFLDVSCRDCLSFFPDAQTITG